MTINNWSNHPKEDNISESRKQLIQRATTRLRRRLLEEKLQDVMRQLVQLQAQLETVRADTAATISTISNMPEEVTEEGVQKMNRQMDTLEKRLEMHQVELNGFICPHNEPSDIIPDERLSSFTTLSRFSSLSFVSSFFGGASTRATSISSETFEKKTGQVSQEDNQQKKEKRRRRVKDQRRRYQESVINASSQVDSEKVAENDWHFRHILCTVGDEDNEEEDNPFYDLSGKRSFRAGSFCGSVYGEEIDTSTSSEVGSVSQIAWRRHRILRRKNLLNRIKNKNDMDDNYDDDDGIFSASDISSSDRSAFYPKEFSLSNSISFSQDGQSDSAYGDDEDEYSKRRDIWTLQSYYMNTHLYPERNVLDEAMSFLDDVENDADDGGFCEDLYLLLRNPDLCCRPFSEIESAMHELRQQQQRQHGNPIQPVKDMMYKATTSTLKWCKFLSVLSVAVVISIMKGPEDLAHNLPISR
ncbi:hypothetical protein G6F37_010621 [Rhizopus arrhizus]|nr:hypothetical protein G6F38_011241 [Rhizopus arrhizus]KAG1153150.1 hypothetical protein G6F37_010621 [Rhizopus arrhizus]